MSNDQKTYHTINLKKRKQNIQNQTIKTGEGTQVLK